MLFAENEVFNCLSDVLSQKMKLLVAFLIISRQVLGWYLETGRRRILAPRFKFIHSYLNIQYCIQFMKFRCVIRKNKDPSFYLDGNV